MTLIPHIKQPECTVIPSSSPLSCLLFEQHVSEWRVSTYVLIPESVEGFEYRNMVA